MTANEIRARFNEIWPFVQKASVLDQLLRRLQSDLMGEAEPESRDRSGTPLTQETPR